MPALNRGMRMAKRHQEAEEGLCCLQASGGSNNNNEVGGPRSCRCYREDLGVGRRDNRCLRRASAASKRVGGAALTRRLGAGAAAGACYREDLVEGRSGMERVSKGCQQEECLWWRDSRRFRRASATSKRVGGATTTRSLVPGAAAGAIEKILGGQEWLERVSKECQQECVW